MTLDEQYGDRYESVLKPLAVKLQLYLGGILDGIPRVDRVSARAKGVASFVEKAEKLDDDKNAKYSSPLTQIQDQIGARIVTFFRTDVESISRDVTKYLREIEFKDKTPESEWEFGYFGRHFVMLMPTDVVDPDWDPDQIPAVFELQIKTLFQHSWSEANHDLGYKPAEIPFLPDEKRYLAYASAQAWGADRIFDDLHKRREASKAVKST